MEFPAFDIGHWIESAVGGCDECSVCPVPRPPNQLLAGDPPSLIFNVRIRADGVWRKLVLRMYKTCDERGLGTRLAENEAAVLVYLEQCDVHGVPQLVRHEYGAAGKTPPMVLMTFVPGTSILNEPQLALMDIVLLAAQLRKIHETPVSSKVSGLLPYTPHHFWAGPHQPPVWTRCPEYWREAIDLYENWSPTPLDSSFIHRDFHLGNILWTGHEISGVIDWVSSGVGNVLADVGHFRMNLAISYGPELCNCFTQAYCGDSISYDEIWDILAAVGVLPDLGKIRQDEVLRLDEFVKTAIRKRG